jgi:two-component system, NarL family, response regulator NreC
VLDPEEVLLRMLEVAGEPLQLAGVGAARLAAQLEAELGDGDEAQAGAVGAGDPRRQGQRRGALAAAVDADVDAAERLLAALGEAARGERDRAAGRLKQRSAVGAEADPARRAARDRAAEDQPGTVREGNRLGVRGEGRGQRPRVAFGLLAVGSGDEDVAEELRRGALDLLDRVDVGSEVVVHPVEARRAWSGLHPWTTTRPSSPSVGAGGATLRPMSDEGDERQIAIVLADDHALVRGALRALLETQRDLRVVGEAGDLADGREAVAGQSPDVLVLDVNLPDGLGIDAVADLRRDHPDTQIVLLTMERDIALARRALDDGALGYLFKDAAHLELVEAVRAAANGERYLPAAVAAGLSHAPDDGADRTLSPRETDVLRLMALGHTNREIGEQLDLSVRTIETHRAHIQQKLGLSTRPELTRYALEHDLIDT